MSGVGIALSVVGLVAGAVEAGQQAHAQNKAAKESAAARAAQQQAEDIKTQQQQRQVLMQARVKAAAAEQAGVNQGAGIGSSAVQGGTGSLVTQGYNIDAYLGQYQNANQIATQHLQNAAIDNAQASSAGAFSGLAFKGAKAVYDNDSSERSTLKLIFD